MKANKKQTKGKGGGRRKRSGRPATIHTVQRLSVCLDQPAWDGIQAYARLRGLTVAGAARELFARAGEGLAPSRGELSAV